MNAERMMKWTVYDSCAEWCAKRGFKGVPGDPLPDLLDSEVAELINADPEAFELRVRQCAYALAMEETLREIAKTPCNHGSQETCPREIAQAALRPSQAVSR